MTRRGNGGGGGDGGGWGGAEEFDKLLRVMEKLLRASVLV